MEDLKIFTDSGSTWAEALQWQEIGEGGPWIHTTSNIKQKMGSDPGSG